MYKITVAKWLSDKTAVETASRAKVLLDHLEASAKRNGFEVTWNEPGVSGGLVRDGREVGGWFIEEVRDVRS